MDGCMAWFSVTRNMEYIRWVFFSNKKSLWYLVKFGKVVVNGGGGGGCQTRSFVGFMPLRSFDAVAQKHDDDDEDD